MEHESCLKAEKVSRGDGDERKRHAKPKMLELKHKTLAQEHVLIRLALRGASKKTLICEPTELVRQAIEKHDRIAVSWSGGRCSTVVLHMARQIRPDIMVFHTDHGVLYPEISKFVRELSHAWKLNLFIVKPEKTFWEVTAEHGFPKMRRPASIDRKVKSVGIPKCCNELKHKPEKRFAREHSIDAFLTGLRVAEAQNRALGMRRSGQYHFPERLKAWKYYPIAFWTTRELNAYIQEHDVPISPIYERTDRTGCWPCTAHVKWREDLMQTHPKLYDFMVEKLGGQRMLEHFYRTHIEPPPCHTERVAKGVVER